MTDKFQELVAQAGTPLSPVAEDFVGQLRDGAAVIRIDFEVPSEPLSTDPPAFVVDLKPKRSPMVSRQIPWSPRLDRELYSRGIRMGSLVGESLRSATNLAFTLRFGDIQYGSEFVDEVLWDVVYKRYGTIPAVAHMLSQIRRNPSPPTSDFYDCKEFIERQIDGYQNSLGLELGYDGDDPYRILVAALCSVLDQRHHLTARRSLFPARDIVPAFVLQSDQSEPYDQSTPSSEQPVPARPELKGQVFGYWFGPRERIPKDPPGVPTGAVLPRGRTPFKTKQLSCLDLVNVQNYWLVLSELGRYTYNHTTGLLRGEDWSFVPVPEVTGRWPVAYAVSYDEPLSASEVARLYGADVASRARPDAPAVQLRLVQRSAAHTARLTAGSMENELRDRIPELDRKAITESGDSLNVPNGPMASVTLPIDGSLADAAPAAAIITAWTRLEDIIVRNAHRVRVVDANEIRPGQIVSLLKRLLDAGVIDQESLAALMAVRTLRNKVVHSWDETRSISGETAAKFVGAADELGARVRSGADRVHLATLLSDLRANNAAEVTVGPLATSAVSGSPEAARDMAEARRGKWGAQTRAVSSLVSEEDAALLLQHGAKYKRALR